METQNKERSASTFILKERFQKAQFAHPTEFFTSDKSGPDLVDLEDHQEWFEVNTTGQISIHNEPDAGTIGVDHGTTEPCPSKASTGN